MNADVINFDSQTDQQLVSREPTTVSFHCQRSHWVEGEKVFLVKCVNHKVSRWQICNL